MFSVTCGQSLIWANLLNALRHQQSVSLNLI
jgi:hypothetical protein